MSESAADLPPQPFEVFGLTMTYPNILSVTWITFTLVVFFTLTCRDLRKLAVDSNPAFGIAVI